MSKTYRIHGARYLRKYSAKEKSSIYSYMSDVRTIANSLCKVPWERVRADIAATTTIHTEEGLDWNVEERDRFDAAEWCGEHSDGFHRAFAQAACYVFKLPASAVGSNVEKLGIMVTSDPYNPYGARISAMTSNTLSIPTACETVRTGEMYRLPDEDGMGAAPRLFMRNADGTQTWYSNSEKVELQPAVGASAVTLKQYLFVFVCLENYNRGRDGWIEGSSYIDNDLELTLTSACQDLVEGELNDLSQVVSPVELPIVSGGIVGDMNGLVSGVLAATVTAAGTSPEMNGQYVDNILQLTDETAPASNRGGVSAAYAKLETGNMSHGAFGSCHINRKRIGIGFSVKQSTAVQFVGINGQTSSPRTVTVTACSMFVPFSVPSWKPSKIEFDWSTWLTGRSPTAGTKFRFYLKGGSYLTEYDAAAMKAAAAYKGEEVAGWTLLGSADVSAGSATFNVSFGSGTVGTIFMTAYLPQDSVSDIASDFCIGTSSAWYNSATPDSAIGVSHDYYLEYSSGTVYTIGDNIRLGFSSGNSWSSGSSFGKTRMCYVGGVWLCCGSFGIRRSTDGVTWTNTNVTGSCSYDFSYGNGVWIALTSSGSADFRRSTDGGITWTTVSKPASVTTAKAPKFFRNKFVTSVNNVGIFTSDDGQTWDKRKDVSSSISAPLVSGERIYCDNLTSTDGVSWTSTTGKDETPTKFACKVGDVHLHVGVYGYSVSSDGVSFEYHDWPSGIYTACASKGEICVCAFSDDEKIMFTRDGTTWENTNVRSSSLKKILLYRGCFYAFGDNIAYKSFDGESWSEISFPLNIWQHCADASERRIVCESNSGSVYKTDLDSEIAYRCSVATSSPSFVLSEWSEIEDPVRSRMFDVNQLCVPDISLIG